MESEEQHERVIHPVDTTQEHEKLWLVKVPSEVAEAWSNIKESDVDLGTLNWYAEKKGTKARKCTVSLNKFGSKKMVTEYTLDQKMPPDGALFRALNLAFASH